MHLDSTFDALSNGTNLQVSIPSISGSFWGKKLIFRNFHPKFSIGFDSRFLLIPPKCSFMIQNITTVSALQNDTSFAFLLHCKLSELTVLSENLQFEMNIADFWRKLIKGLYKLKLNIKTCFL